MNYQNHDKNSIQIKVAIVDDNRSLRNTLVESLNHQAQIEVILQASGGDDFLNQLKGLQKERLPDVVIMDVHMPGMNGIEVVKHGKALFPKMKFLMLTGSEDDDIVFDAIQSGASGYLLKNEKLSVIIEHVHQLSRNSSVPMSPVIARKVLNLLTRLERSNETPEARSAAEMYSLTSREEEVLNWLVEGLDFRQIASELHISPNTVRKHISNIYEKLHVSSKAQAIKLMHNRPGRNLNRITPCDAEQCALLLVDDHQLILDSLSMMLSAKPEYKIAGTINNPIQVKQFLDGHSIDLLISDVRMPGMNGIELATMVREEFPDVKILLLTVSDDLEQVQKAIEIGVEGYILKKTGKKELTHAIDTILDGQTYYGTFLPTVRS
jgi:DNA-binding NarL/FixJ family response regulator